MFVDYVISMLALLRRIYYVALRDRTQFSFFNFSFKGI